MLLMLRRLSDEPIRDINPCNVTRHTRYKNVMRYEYGEKIILIS